MKKYKYRDKIHGKWIDEPVEEAKILELVTRGTLTPYDFVQIFEDEEAESKMILDEFAEAEEKWAKLRKIRLELNKLWEGQLDDVMAIISSGLHPNIENRAPEPSLLKYRESYPSVKFEEKLKHIWHPGILSDFVRNELHYRQNSPQKPEEIDLSLPNENDRMDEDYLEDKKQKLKDALSKPGIWTSGKQLGEEAGVYAFFAPDKEKAIRVGKTGNFRSRFSTYYNSQNDPYPKVFSEASKIELYNVNQNIGGRLYLDVFESLMIFRHANGSSDEERFLPEYNTQLPRASQIEKALGIIDAEISQLKGTG